MTFINFYIYKTIRELYKFKKEHKSKIFYQICKTLVSFEEQEYYNNREHEEHEDHYNHDSDTVFVGSSGFTYSATESYIFGMLEVDPFFNEEYELGPFIDRIELKRFVPDLLNFLFDMESREQEQRRKMHSSNIGAGYLNNNKYKDLNDSSKKQDLSEKFSEKNTIRKDLEDNPAESVRLKDLPNDYGEFVNWPYFKEINSFWGMGYTDNSQTQSKMTDEEIKEYGLINFPFIELSDSQFTNEWNKKWSIKEWSMYLPEIHNEHCTSEISEPFFSYYPRNAYKEYFGFYINVYISYFLKHCYKNKLHHAYSLVNCDLISSLSIFEQDLWGSSFDLDEFDKTNFTYTVLMDDQQGNLWDTKLYRIYDAELVIPFDENYNTIYYDVPFKISVSPFIRNWGLLVHLQYLSFNNFFNLNMVSLGKKQKKIINNNMKQSISKKIKGRKEKIKKIKTYTKLNKFFSDLFRK